MVSMMSADSFVAYVLNGLVQASSLFLIASGLTLIFGVLRILNFAHAARPVHAGGIPGRPGLFVVR